MSALFESVSDFMSGLSTVIEMDKLNPTLETTKAVRHYAYQFAEHECNDYLKSQYPGLYLRGKHLIESSDKATIFYLQGKEKMQENFAEIKVKYFKHDEDDEPTNLIGQINGSDWVDLYTATEVIIDPNEQLLIPLGVGMALPPNCEAIIAPRSSTFKRWGIMQTNGIGVIDNSYCGNDDEWRMPVINMRDETVTIPRGTRICQFRILQNQPNIRFTKVDELHSQNRGGFGSTGK